MGRSEPLPCYLVFSPKHIFIYPASVQLPNRFELPVLQVPGKMLLTHRGALDEVLQQTTYDTSKTVC